MIDFITLYLPTKRIRERFYFRGQESNRPKNTEPNTSDLEVQEDEKRAKNGIIILSRLKRGVGLRPLRSSRRTAEPTV